MVVEAGLALINGQVEMAARELICFDGTAAKIISKDHAM